MPTMEPTLPSKPWMSALIRSAWRIFSRVSASFSAVMGALADQPIAEIGDRAGHVADGVAPFQRGHLAVEAAGGDLAHRVVQLRHRVPIWRDRA